MTDFLFYGDTERSPAMRHELPVAIGDPFLLAVIDGRMQVAVSGLERDRVAAAAPDAVLHDFADLGFYELLKSGLSLHELDLELDLPRRRGDGRPRGGGRPGDAGRGRRPAPIRRPRSSIRITQAIAARRRSEIGGGACRHSQGAGRGACRHERRRGPAAPSDAQGRGSRSWRRGPDRRGRSGRAARCVPARAARRRRRMSSSPPCWQGFGHEPGSGPLPANLPIAIDLWPRDEPSGCWADMTRTFVVGEVGDDRASAGDPRAAGARGGPARPCRPGVTGRELHAHRLRRVRVRAGTGPRRTGPDEDGPERRASSSRSGTASGSAIHEGPALGQIGARARWSPAT